MGSFCRDLARHVPGVFLHSLVRADTTFDILSKLILALLIGASSPVTDAALGFWNQLTNSETTLNGVPLWWSLIVLGLIFLHGLFRYAKEDKDKVERERDELRKGETTRKKRMVLRDMLAMAEEDGERLHASDLNVKDAEKWVTHVHNLIEAGLGKGEARLFLRTMDTRFTLTRSKIPDKRPGLTGA